MAGSHRRILALAAALAVPLTVHAHGATRRVPSEYATIQAAIDSSVSGDAVLVAPGVYTETIDFHGKAIAVVGESGPGVTVIDGGHADSVVIFEGREDREALLQGFTIRNGGFNPDNHGRSRGQGIRVGASSPRIVGNHIVDNEGCGITAYFGSPMIVGNHIMRNGARCIGEGGGIQIVARDERGTLSEIRSNVVSGNLRGGMSLTSVDAAVVEGNLIEENRNAVAGGGIALGGYSPAKIVQNVIAGNHAQQRGGGIAISTSGAAPSVAHNTIVGNLSGDGSDVMIETFFEGTEIVNNIIATSAGGTSVHCGRFGPPGPAVFRSNDVFSFSGARFAGTCPDLTGLDGNVGDDPGLACLPRGDYALDSSSRCVDAAESGLPHLPAEDLSGNPRVTDGDGDGVSRPDIGAIEFQPDSPKEHCAYVLCPADRLALVRRGEEAGQVEYPSPWAAPGSAVTCLPPSGSSFLRGDTTVDCLAAGPAGDTASCSFTVTVDVRAPNDDFDEATPIPALPFTDSLHTSSATAALDDPYCLGIGSTIWYSLTLARNVWVTLDGSGSDYSATVSVYTGSRGALDPVVCNNGPALFRAEAGERYSIMVGSEPPGPGGHLDLSVTGVPGMNVELSAAPEGAIAAERGDVTVSGEVSCTFPGEVDVYAYLLQEKGTTSEASSHARLACDLVGEWALRLSSPQDPFRAGWATLYLFAAASRYGTGEAADANASGPILLKGSAGKPEPHGAPSSVPLRMR